MSFDVSFTTLLVTTAYGYQCHPLGIAPSQGETGG